MQVSFFHEFVYSDGKYRFCFFVQRRKSLPILLSMTRRELTEHTVENIAVLLVDRVQIFPKALGV
jgi:hypothetical protein